MLFSNPHSGGARNDLLFETRDTNCQIQLDVGLTVYKRNQKCCPSDEFYVRRKWLEFFLQFLDQIESLAEDRTG